MGVGVDKYVVGWEVAQGGARDAISSLKKRSCRGPTSMKPELAVLTANMARVSYMDSILDPCVGAGSLLQAAAALSCNTAVCIAADRDCRALEWTRKNFLSNKLRPPCGILADVGDRHWVRQEMEFNVMVSDLPYGIREEIADPLDDPAQGSKGSENFRRIMNGALSIAQRVLPNSGRFACWIPQFALVELSSVLCEGKGSESNALEMECVLQEERDGGVQRALAVFRAGKGNSASGPAKVPPGVRRWSSPSCSRSLHSVDITASDPQNGKELAVDVWKAAWNGQLPIVWQYLESGGDVNQVDPDSDCTMLQLAAGYGREAVCVLLLEHRANVLADAGKSGSAIHRAARHGHVGVVSAILERGGIQAMEAASLPDVDRCTAIFYAARYGHEDCLLLLLNALGKHDMPALVLEQPGSQGLTPLCAAARFGKIRAMEILLAHDVDPLGCTACDEQLTPAHLAARWGHAEACEVLHRSCASSLFCMDAHGKLPLDEARAWKRTACIEILMRWGC
mmetsp:Transcript_6186/g.38470  ORF Transcript_6186/g.38470 Transcript_6186/m.38470 type:complete len:511 (-) Transcript_6186:1438-2970(-)